MIQLFKKGTSLTIRGIRCDMQTVNEYSYLHLLDDGWRYTPEETVEKVIEEVVEEIVEETPDPADELEIVPEDTIPEAEPEDISDDSIDDIEEKDDTPESDSMAELEIIPDEDDEKSKDDAIRQAAKAAGIKGWYNTGIEKLIEKMKELENGGSEG